MCMCVLLVIDEHRQSQARIKEGLMVGWLVTIKLSFLMMLIILILEKECLKKYGWVDANGRDLLNLGIKRGWIEFQKLQTKRLDHQVMINNAIEVQ